MRGLLHRTDSTKEQQALKKHAMQSKAGMSRAARGRSAGADLCQGRPKEWYSSYIAVHAFKYISQQRVTTHYTSCNSSQ